jgi:DNA repair protein RadC
MKEQFLKSGFNGFEPYQILETLLFYACPRKDTREIAKALLARFGDLEGVFKADADELASAPGMGESAAVLLKMVPACASVCLSPRLTKRAYDDTKKLKELFEASFVGLRRETLCFACFDADLCLIGNSVVSSGALCFSEKTVRKIVETAIRSNACAAALAHNRPNGLAAASAEVAGAARNVNHILKSMGIRLLDFITVGADATASMRENAELTVFD